VLIVDREYDDAGDFSTLDTVRPDFCVENEEELKSRNPKLEL
jgi:hypothetical protein